MTDAATATETGTGPDAGETSRDGLRRMQRLCAGRQASTSLGSGSASLAALHPLTSTLVYPPTGTGQRHLVTSIFAETSPRALPLPPALGRAKALSISPDGAWVITYHASTDLARPLHAHGDLYIHPASLLEPGTSPASFLPLARFGMAQPLALLHVYPPRTRLGGQKAAPARGPAPPPGHVNARMHGPTLVVLTADLVYLLHPHPVPATVQLDTRSAAAAPHGSVSATGGGESAPLNWTVNELKCSIGSRSYADLSSVATMPGSYPAYGAQRGWLSMVGGSDGIWAAVEKDGDVRVIRIDIGLDANNIPFLSTAPLPTLPRTNASPDALLEQVAFVPLREHVVNGTAAEKAEMAKVTNEPVSSIGAVMVYSEGTRTRFELCELRHRPVAIVDGFKDLAAGDDFSAPLDWVPAPHVRTTAVSPRGTSILTLTPLPDVPPYTLAVALVARPTGLALTHVNLVPPAEGDTAGAGKPRWPVLVGEEYALDASVGATGAALLPSQGVRRGEMGLVAVLGDGRPRLVPSPRLGTGAAPHETLKHTAERAARSVELAVIQGVDWSDALRAAFASVPRAQACDLAAAILDQAFSLFVNHARSYAPHILRLQVAVWALADDHRRVFADEMLRLGEAAQVLHLCGAERDGEIRFDLDSVWHLVDVFEWAIGTLGQVFREAISERAHAEWAPGVNSSTAASTSTRVLYLVHPLLRRILSRVVALLAAFAKFASTLDVPVRPPDGALLLPRSASAAAVVTQRVGDAVAREGVDLKMWADVLSTLDAKVARPSDADACAALLKFEVGALASLVPGALHHVPTPSALFLAPGPQPRDGASCALLGDKATARCDRCAAHTVVPPARTGVLSPWAAWRRTFVANCMCGGTWVRTHADKRA